MKKQKISSYKAQGCIIFMLAIVLFTPVFVCAADFDNSKNTIEVVKDRAILIGDRTINYNPLWEKYQPIEIKNLFGLGSTLMTGAIMKHTEVCGKDCSSEIEISIAKDGVLIDEVKFLEKQNDGKWIAKDIQYQFYIKTVGTEWLVDDYGNECKEILANGSIKCNPVIIGNHYENNYIYEPYAVGEEVKAGNYYLKLEGKRDNPRWIDWQITSQGKLIEEWATWGDYISSFATGGTGGTNNPSRVATNGSRIIVGDGGNSNLYMYDMSGNFIRIIATTYGAWDSGIGWNGSNWFSVNQDPSSREITKYDANMTKIGSCIINEPGYYFDVKANGSNLFVQKNFPEFQIKMLNFSCEVKSNISIYQNSYGFGIDSTYLYVGNTNNVTATLYTGSRITSFNLEGTNQNNKGVDKYGDDIYTVDATSDKVYKYYGTITEDGSPKIEIVVPTTLVNYGSSIQNLSWKINDSTFQSAWFSYNGTNITISNFGKINSTLFALWYAPYNLTLYANDSFGNQNSSYVEWNYKVFENNHSFTTPVTSGDSNTFSINLTYDSSFTGISTLLEYAGTNYTMSSSDIGNTKTYSYLTTAPVVTATTNKTFRFIILLSNSSGNYQVNSASYNQTINPFLIDNCTTNSNVLLNMTMIDEETLAGINGTIEALVNVYGYGTSNLIGTYNRSFNYIDPIPARVCINSTGTYRVDYTIKHYGNETDYFKKYRNVQNLTITSTDYTKQLVLYNLLLADGYTFRITVTGSTLNPLLVSVYKQYIPWANFDLVESPLTSSNDEAIAHLIPQSAVYNFVVSYMGRILGTFNNYQVTCQNPSIGQCTILLPLGETTFEPIPNYNYPGNISVLSYLNQTNHILTTVFNSIDGNSHTIVQLVLKNDGYGNTTICNNTLFGTSGTLTCSIPTQYQNSSFFLQILSDGKLIGTGLFSQGSNPNYYGVNILIEIMMYTTLVMMMLGHPILIIIGAILGLIFAIVLVYLAGGSFAAILASLIFFVAAGITIIWQISRKI